MSQENNNSMVTITQGEDEVKVSQNVSLAELTPQSISSFEPNVQASIQALADTIDVTEMDKVNSYAEAPMQKGISDLMTFLEKMKGTEEDKQSVKFIAELSEKVNTEINDIKIIPKEMGFFEKLLARLKGDPQENVLKKINSCITLINKLAEHMANEIALVSERQDDAARIIDTNVEVVEKLEQYLVAGYIADERIQSSLDLMGSSGTLMIREQVEMQKTKDGLDLFRINLSNLEKTRYATYLAILQTMGNKSALEKLENNFKSTMRNLLLIFAQQSANTLLGYTVKNAIDSHNNITKLNTAMMESNATSLKKNYEDVAKLITAGVADVEKMRKCAEVILDGAKKHNEILSEYVDHLDEHRKEMADALEPVKEFFALTSGISDSPTSHKKSTSTQNNSDLKF